MIALRTTLVVFLLISEAGCKSRKSINLESQSSTNARFPDQIGFGKSSTGADVGTFTVELMHRTKVPADLAGKVFAIGDSLSSVDPWTGSGVNKAIFEGVTAARFIANLLVAPHRASALLQEYESFSALNTLKSLNKSLDVLKPTIVSQQVDDPDAP
jgi:2-polyprenyl-6-methoxyphenol hydroxylase-like FAD-dependent oxidoreductase